MKKMITRIVYAGMFLTAALVLGQKMFMEDRVIDDDRAHIRTGSANSIIAGSHVRNMSSVEGRVKITGIHGGIGDFFFDGDGIFFAGEDFVYEDEDQDQPGESGYGNAAHNAGDSEKITGSHNHNDSSSIHAGPANGAATHPASSGKVGRLRARESRNGASGLGGGGWGGNGAGGKGNTGKDSAGNAPGTNAGTTPGQEKAAPAHEDKNDPERDNKQNGDHPAADGKEAANPPDKEIPPYFEAPPGTLEKEPGDPFQPQIPAEGIGNQDHEGAGISGNPGARAIPEPASSLLIGLGSVMLLWSRRRNSRS